MTKRVAFIGTAIAILAIGLVCLVLWQTGVISRQTWTGVAADLAQAKPCGQGPDNPGGKAVLELRQLPAPEDGKKGLEPGDQTAPTPQLDGPPSIQEGPGPASELQGPSQPGPGAEKPVAVPQVGEGERRYPGQGPVAQAESAAPGKKDGHPGDRSPYRPVVISFGFDPYRDREMNVAIVHSGDTIGVKVRPAGQEGCKLYLTFSSSGTLETKAYREWSTGSQRMPAVPIRNGSRITLAGAGDFGAGVQGKLNTKEGAVLKLGIDCSTYRRDRFHMDDRCACEIEMRIYSGNRWNIRPKSLL
jgi:hypothetical protein